jgi:hypothetical protein
MSGSLFWPLEIEHVGEFYWMKSGGRAGGAGANAKRQKTFWRRAILGILYDQIKCNHCIVIAYFTAYRVYNGIDIITVEVGQVDLH